MRMKMFFVFLLAMPAIAMAGVNTKNGNFYITYEDVSLKAEDHAVAVNRTYNSKASGIGWFGFGWASTYETRLIVMPDGSVIVHEQGLGQTNRYYPKGGADLKGGVEKIIEAALQRGELTPDTAGDMRQKLLISEDLRVSKVLRYGIQTQLPQGVAVQCCAATIMLVDNEYRRTLSDTSHEYFDLLGRMIRKEEDGYTVTIHYAGTRPDAVSDSLGQRINYKWTESGLATEAASADGSITVRYSYDKKDNLVTANTLYGLIYHYKYDRRHNMTQIRYIDNSRMFIRYDMNGDATFVTETDGTKTAYAYRIDPADPRHYWVTITLNHGTRERSVHEQEFLSIVNASGVEILQRVTDTQHGNKYETVWDEQGRVKHIRRPYGEFIEYTYHPTLNLISMVQTEDGKTEFQYDAAGQLVRAEKSDGKLIELSYDQHKHVLRMVETDKGEQTRRELTFKYNAMGKPVEINMAGKGKITVAYDGKGEITKVDSTQGSHMALEVMQAFQSLLSVVKVAGVGGNM